MYAIMLGLILVNIFMFLQGKYLTSLFAKVVSIPQQILTPIIVIFCFAGAYSVNSSYFRPERCAGVRRDGMVHA